MINLNYYQTRREGVVRTHVTTTSIPLRAKKIPEGLFMPLVCNNKRLLSQCEEGMMSCEGCYVALSNMARAEEEEKRYPSGECRYIFTKRLIEI